MRGASPVRSAGVAVLLAELEVRHTRRHMPTRRVALGRTYLPTSGPGHGPVLLGAVMGEFARELDDDARELLPAVLDDARRGGLRVPGIGLRHRLQNDTHGLDRSRHRLSAEGGLLVLELDVHGAAVPQVLGAVMAAAALPPTAREAAVRALRRAAAAGPALAGLQVRRLLHGVPVERPWAPGTRRVAGGPAAEDEWVGVPAERRWAMELLGVPPRVALERDDVNRRFRRLLRAAHPDHGARRDGAAERIAELSEARDLLLAWCDPAASAGS